MRNWGELEAIIISKFVAQQTTTDAWAQITINTVIEHTIGNRTEFTDKWYGPFKMEVPKLSKPDMYKFLTYTLLQNNLTVLSTETIAEIGATITTHLEQFFKYHKVGALKS